MGGASSIASKGKAALTSAASGGASSSSISTVDHEASAGPVEPGPETIEVTITPLDENVKSKASPVVLEVGLTGFRLLKPSTRDAIFQFPWGQIHSWAHGNDRFSFRFFEERTKNIVRYSFQVKGQDLKDLMACIQRIIDKILGERKSQNITEEDFGTLVTLVESSGPSDRLDCITSSAQMNFFTSKQAHKLVSSLEAAFDKVEAAATLHPRLVDQNRFMFVLEALECQEDRENVWHRLSAQKRQNSTRSRQG